MAKERENHAAAWSHVDVCGLYRFLQTYWCKWSVLPSEAMVMSESVLPLKAIYGSVVLLQPQSLLMSMTHATTKGQVDICVLCCSLKHVDIHGLCCLPTARLTSLACIATGDHDEVHSMFQCWKICDVCDSCCVQKPWLSPWLRWL